MAENISLTLTAKVLTKAGTIDTRLVERATAAALQRIQIPPQQIQAQIGVKADVRTQDVVRQIKTAQKQIAAELGKAGIPQSVKKNLVTQQQILGDLQRTLATSIPRTVQTPQFKKMVQDLRAGNLQVEQLTTTQLRNLKKFQEVERLTQKTLRSVSDRATRVSGVPGTVGKDKVTGQPTLFPSLGVGAQTARDFDTAKRVQSLRKEDLRLAKEVRKAEIEAHRLNQQFDNAGRGMDRRKAEIEAYKELGRRAKEFHKAEAQAYRENARFDNAGRGMDPRKAEIEAYKELDRRAKEFRKAEFEAHRQNQKFDNAGRGLDRRKAEIEAYKELDSRAKEFRKAEAQAYRENARFDNAGRGMDPRKAEIEAYKELDRRAKEFRKAEFEAHRQNQQFDNAGRTLNPRKAEIEAYKELQQRADSLRKAEFDAHREDTRRTKEAIQAQRQLFRERESFRRDQAQRLARSGQAGRISEGNRLLRGVGGAGSVNFIHGRENQRAALEAMQMRRSVQGQRLNSMFASGAGLGDAGVQRMQTRIHESDRAIQTLTGRLERFNQVQDQSTRLMRQFFRYAIGYGALYAALGSVIALTRGIANMNKELVSIRAIAEATAEDMLIIEKAITSVALSTKFNIQEIAKAARVLAQSGVLPDELPGTLASTAQFAAATESSIEVAADLLSTMRNVFDDLEDSQLSNQLTKAVNISKLTADDLKSILSISAGVAADYNLASEQYLAAVTVLRNAGLKASTVATGLRQGILELFTPSGRALRKLKKRYEELGENLSEAMIRDRFFEFREADNPLVAGLRELDRIGFTGSGQATLSRMFNVRSENAIRALIRDLDELETSSARLTFGNAALAGSDIQMQSLSNTLDNLGAAITALSYGLSRGLVDSLQEAAEGATELVEKMSEVNEQVEAATGRGVLGNVGLGVLAGGLAAQSGFGAMGLGKRILAGSAVGVGTTGGLTAFQNATPNMDAATRTFTDMLLVLGVLASFRGIRGSSSKTSAGLIAGAKKGLDWLATAFFALSSIAKGGSGRLLLAATGKVGLVVAGLAALLTALNHLFTDGEKRIRKQTEANTRRRISRLQELRDFRDEARAFRPGPGGQALPGTTYGEVANAVGREQNLQSDIGALAGPGGPQGTEHEIRELLIRLNRRGAEAGTAARRLILEPLAAALGTTADALEDKDRVVSRAAAEAEALDGVSKALIEEVNKAYKRIDALGGSASRVDKELLNAIRAAAVTGDAEILQGGPGFSVQERLAAVRRLLGTMGGALEDFEQVQLVENLQKAVDDFTSIFRGLTEGGVSVAQFQEQIANLNQDLQRDLGRTPEQVNALMLRAAEGLAPEPVRRRATVHGEIFETPESIERRQEFQGVIGLAQTAMETGNLVRAEAVERTRANALDQINGIVQFFADTSDTIDRLDLSPRALQKARETVEKLAEDPTLGLVKDPRTGTFSTTAEVAEAGSIRAQAESRKATEDEIAELLRETRQELLPDMLQRIDLEGQLREMGRRDTSASIVAGVRGSLFNNQLRDINERRRVAEERYRVEKEALEEEGGLDSEEVNRRQREFKNEIANLLEEEHRLRRDFVDQIDQDFEAERKQNLERRKSFIELEEQRLESLIASAAAGGDVNEIQALDAKRIDLVKERVEIERKLIEDFFGPLTDAQERQLEEELRAARAVTERADIQEALVDRVRRDFEKLGFYTPRPGETVGQATARAEVSGRRPTMAQRGRLLDQQRANLLNQQRGLQQSRQETLAQPADTPGRGERLQELQRELEAVENKLAGVDEESKRLSATIADQLSEAFDGEQIAAQIQALDGGLENLGINLRERVVVGLDGFADAFSRALTSGESFSANMKNLMRSLLNDLAAMIIKHQILSLIANLFGGFMMAPAAAAGGGGGGSRVLSAPGGGVYAASGGVVGSGRVVNSIIRGPGSGTSDSVAAAYPGGKGTQPLLVSDGEGILNAAAVKALGESTVHEINRRAARMSSGGIVGGKATNLAAAGGGPQINYHSNNQFKVEVEGGDENEITPEVREMLKQLNRKSEEKTREMIQRETRPGGVIYNTMRSRRL